MYPPKRSYDLTICIPSSVFSVVDTLIEKTIIAGLIARILSIYRVERVVVYLDSYSNRKDANLMKELLEYAETPQYLRRYLFPLSQNLKYAGLIPPLRTPHHPTIDSDIEFRDGYVLKSEFERSVVDIGLKNPIECPFKLPQNKRVSMRRNGSSWVPIEREKIPYYWGYEVFLDVKGLGHHLKNFKYDHIISTSRLGTPICSIIDKIKNILKPEKRIAILFGSPYEGLHEILRKDSIDINAVSDIVVNMVPNQGTATVRTEEALIISLAIISVIELI
ncbi:MAG: RNA methyltransferase [Candidatus Methanomethyliaceae archaeon]|nr:RNA methyltransferase [Candidatus Methanomethyliaceae archaeon]MDW7970336.1 putative RNA uridine N3 methyltransferase [Nitrososphaerota archaeon]